MQHQKFLIFTTLFFLSTNYYLQAQNRSQMPMFESIADYTGNPYLVMNLLLSIDQQATKVTISNSFDGKKWEDFAEIPTDQLHDNSFENTPLSISIQKLESLIAKTKDKIYFSASYTIADRRYVILNNIELSKNDLIAFKKKK